MLIERPDPAIRADIRPSEITSESAYCNRRQFFKRRWRQASTGVASAWTSRAAQALSDLKYTRNGGYSIEDEPNSYEDITTYNNFYEFGVDKGAPAAQLRQVQTAPWTVTVGAKQKSQASSRSKTS